MPSLLVLSFILFLSSPFLSAAPNPADFYRTDRFVIYDSYIAIFDPKSLYKTDNDTPALLTHVPIADVVTYLQEEEMNELEPEDIQVLHPEAAEKIPGFKRLSFKDYKAFQLENYLVFLLKSSLPSSEACLQMYRGPYPKRPLTPQSSSKGITPVACKKAPVLEQKVERKKAPSVASNLESHHHWAPWRRFQALYKKLDGRLNPFARCPQKHGKKENIDQVVAPEEAKPALSASLAPSQVQRRLAKQRKPDFEFTDQDVNDAEVISDDPILLGAHLGTVLKLSWLAGVDSTDSASTNKETKLSLDELLGHTSNATWYDLLFDDIHMF